MISPQAAVRAGDAAINMAVLVAGPEITAGELISGIIAVVTTHPSFDTEAAAALRELLLIEAEVLKQKLG